MRRKSILSGLMTVMLSLGLALGASAKQDKHMSGSKAMPATATTTQSKTQPMTHASAMHQSMKRMKAEGTIVTSTNDKLEIKTANNNDETFVLNKSTRKPSQLAAGKEVRVWYRESNGQNVASRVSVVSHKPAATSSKATTGSSASMKAQTGSPKSNKPGY